VTELQKALQQEKEHTTSLKLLTNTKEDKSELIQELRNQIQQHKFEK
jgi:hypothetical protein